jgi:hypothetical protein
MRNLIRKILIQLKLSRRKSKSREQLWSKLIKNDNQCRKLRLQMARANKKALTRSEYKINEQKVKQIIYLSLQQLEIRQQLKYG